MKQIITLITLLVVGATLVNAQENERIEGFRDLTWGSHIDSISREGKMLQFTAVEKDDNENGGNYYTLKNDNLIIGSVALTDIYYVFSEKDNRLYRVVLAGRKSDVEEMEFIVDYKYGDNLNEDDLDDKILKQWIIEDVSISLKDYTYNKFELELESDWQAAEAYKKNTNVSDF